MTRRASPPRTARSFQEALRLENSQVNALAKIAAGNSTAKGDQGEDVILNAIRKRLGSGFDAAKGEILDAHGNATPELDCIIYDNSVCAVVSDTLSGRKLVRCESVVMTIQIRARLDANYLEEMESLHFQIGTQLRRHYQPTMHLKSLIALRGKPGDDVESILAHGLEMKWPEGEVPQVVSCVLGYSTRCTEKTASRHIHELSTDYVCVLDKFLIGSSNPGFFENPTNLKRWATGEDSFLALIGIMELALEQYANSRQWVMPDWRQYYRTIERPDHRTAKGARPSTKKSVQST